MTALAQRRSVAPRRPREKAISPEVGKLEGPKQLVDELLAKRRELGQDKHDEVWEGVYHMVPGATEQHQNLAAKLLFVLYPLAEARGLRVAQDLDLRRPGSGDQEACSRSNSAPQSTGGRGSSGSMRPMISSGAEAFARACRKIRRER